MQYEGLVATWSYTCICSEGYKTAVDWDSNLQKYCPQPSATFVSSGPKIICCPYTIHGKSYPIKEVKTKCMHYIGIISVWKALPKDCKVFRWFCLSCLQLHVTPPPFNHHHNRLIYVPMVWVLIDLTYISRYQWLIHGVCEGRVGEWLTGSYWFLSIGMPDHRPQDFTSCHSQSLTFWRIKWINNAIDT